MDEIEFFDGRLNKIKRTKKLKKDENLILKICQRQ